MNFSPEKLEGAVSVAKRAVLTVAPKLVENFGSVEAQRKDDDSPVTELDLWAEHELKKVLSGFDPSIGFLGEEHGAEGNRETYWVIDPIDGTRQFVRGIPFCSTMICLVENKDLLASVIYNFTTNEMYSATKDGGAWLNDQPIKISQRPLSKSVVDVSVNLDDDKAVRVLRQTSEETIALARYNCSAYTNTMVASGRIEGRIWLGRKGGPWDHAPGALLIKEAGGLAVHSDGSEYDIERMDSFIGGTKEVVEMALRLCEDLK